MNSLTGKAMILLAICCSGCAASSQYGETKTVVVRETINELEKEPVPGTVDDVWVEAIHQNVRIPAAVDPKGVYYRPSHDMLVEIRPGKQQIEQYPKQDGSYVPPRPR